MHMIAVNCNSMINALIVHDRVFYDQRTVLRMIGFLCIDMILMLFASDCDCVNN